MRKGARDASGRDRESERERTTEDASKRKADIETGEVKSLRDEPGGCPSMGQAVSGVKMARARSAAPARNVGRRVPIRHTRAVVRGCARGSASYGGNRRR